MGSVINFKRSTGVCIEVMPKGGGYLKSPFYTSSQEITKDVAAKYVNACVMLGGGILRVVDGSVELSRMEI